MNKQTLSYDKENDIYSSHTGYLMRREGENGKWALRNKEGELLDVDRYREDLAERNNITLEQVYSA